LKLQNYPVVANGTLVLRCAMVLALCAAPAAHAGRNCEATKTTLQTVERGLALAEKTLASLNASGQKVVVLARAGQDLGKYGVQYSHLGIAYQQLGPDGRNTWRVLHKLNECGTSASAVYRQGLGEFFMDDLWRYEAAWLALTPVAQERLLELLQNPARAASLHHRPYSMVAYAWGQKYQQSNQWAIETLAAAISPGVGTRQQAQAWLSTSGYVPTTLKLGPLTRLGGRATAANIAFDDHPDEKRFSNRIETVTVDSVFSWLQRAQISVPGKVPTVVKL
jgi:hypothetical protein